MLEWNTVLDLTLSQRYEHYVILRYGAMCFGRCLPTFRRDLLPHSSRYAYISVIACNILLKIIRIFIAKCAGLNFRKSWSSLVCFLNVAKSHSLNRWVNFKFIGVSSVKQWMCYSVPCHSVMCHSVMCHSVMCHSVMRHYVMCHSVMRHSVMRHSVMCHYVMCHSVMRLYAMCHSVMRHSVIFKETENHINF